MEMKIGYFLVIKVTQLLLIFHTFHKLIIGILTDFNSIYLTKTSNI